MNHSDLIGTELHVPFVYGADGLKSAYPSVGDWYFATDTAILYSCILDGTWSIKGLSADGTLNATNLIGNGSFEFHSLGTTGVPDGFALEGTPTLATDTGDIGYGLVSQKITATGAALEGIAITLAGLKALTNYSVSWRTKVTSGDTSRVLSTGAATNILATDSISTTFETKTGSFVTDASGTSVVIKLMAKVDTDVVWFDGLSVVEGSIPFAFSPKPIDDGVWSDYSSISTIVGITAAGISKSIYTKKLGKTVLVSYAISGTGDATTMSFTVPYTASAVTLYSIGSAVNNAGAAVAGIIKVTASGAVIELCKDLAGTYNNWTASGARAVYGSFFFEAI